MVFKKHFKSCLYKLNLLDMDFDTLRMFFHIKYYVDYFVLSYIKFKCMTIARSYLFI